MEKELYTLEESERKIKDSIRRNAREAYEKIANNCNQYV